MLGIILVILIAIIVIANQLQNRKPSEQSLIFLPQFSTPACSEILIVEGKDSAKIARRGSSWFVVSPQPTAGGPAASPLAQPASAQQSASVDEYPADSAAVQTALEKLKNLKKNDLISRNPQKQSDLEVDTAKGIYVEVFNDKSKSIGAFYIGKNGPNWDSHFIREKGSNDVYLASGSVRFSFFGNTQKWKDKTIVKFDKAFIKKLTIANSDSGTIELVKTTPSSPKDTTVKEGWEIVKPEKGKAKKDKVDEIINSFSNFTASEFETDRALTPDSMGFTKPKIVLSATMQNGETKTAMIGKKKGTSGQLWAKNPENVKAIFLIQEYVFNNMNHGVNWLKEIPEVKKEAENAKPAAAKTAKTSSPKSNGNKGKAKKAEAKKK